MEKLTKELDIIKYISLDKVSLQSYTAMKKQNNKLIKELNLKNNEIKKLSDQVIGSKDANEEDL